ncbi:MAG: hypothetical protein ACLRFE_01135 [Clostridia bacterium]
MNKDKKTYFKFKVEYVEADPSKGFNFPYIMLLPKKMKQDIKIMVECANSAGYENDGQQSFGAQINDAKGYANYISEEQDGKKFNLPYLYQELSQPIIIPIIERCEYARIGVIRPHEQDEKYAELDRLGKNTEFYPQQLGRQVMLEKEGKFAKLPEQVVAMVEDAKKKIKTMARMHLKTINIAKKSALVGFSSSSAFASRMQLICPEHFDTCISLCSGGTQPLPLTEINGEKLKYPLGIADFEQIFGKPFNAEEYAKAKQISIVGELEPNGSYNTALKPRLFDKSIRNLFLQVYGNLTLQERQMEIDKILTNAGYTNITCEVLKGVEHSPNGMGSRVLNWVMNNIQNIKQQEQTLQK